MAQMAKLDIRLHVDCPECEEFIDLFDITGLNDEGELIDQVCPTGNWSDAHREFEIEVKCPACDQNFKVKGVEW
jgi:hypothetical protein